MHRDLNVVFYFLYPSDKNCLKKPRVLSKSEESREHSLLYAQNEMKTVKCPL